MFSKILRERILLIFIPQNLMDYLFCLCTLKGNRVSISSNVTLVNIHVSSMVSRHFPPIHFKTGTQTGNTMAFKMQMMLHRQNGFYSLVSSLDKRMQCHQHLIVIMFYSWSDVCCKILFWKGELSFNIFINTSRCICVQVASKKQYLHRSCKKQTI